MTDVDDRPIDLESVTFGYTSQPVLRDVSLSIDAGEYVGVVGPNGSGKSTLLRIALGLHEPDDGRARLFGRPSRTLADRERVGYVAQEATANAGSMPITVREFVRLGRYPLVGFGRLRREDREKTREALRTVAIDDLADRRVGRLSGGQRQRAAIARALAADADLLVLDEPTVGVDAESVGVFYDLLDRLHADGMTILLVEHDLGAVLDRASRVVCLDGEVFYDGPPEGLAESGALAEAYGTAGFFEEVTTA